MSRGEHARTIVLVASHTRAVGVRNIAIAARRRDHEPHPIKTMVVDAGVGWLNDYNTSGLVDHAPMASLHPNLRHGRSDMAPLPADISSPAALAALSDAQLAGLSSLCAAERERRVEAARTAGAACGGGGAASSVGVAIGTPDELKQFEAMTRQATCGAASAGGGRGGGAIGMESQAAVAEEDGCAVHELPTIKARLEL